MSRRPTHHIKGFRPGKEPPQLRRQAVKQQFGELTTAQERMVELFSERTPEQSRALITRWLRISLAVTVALVLLAVAAWLWIPVVGIIVGVLALLAGVVYVRLFTQRKGMESMADAVAQAKRGPVVQAPPRRRRR